MNLIFLSYFFVYLGFLLHLRSSYEYSDKTIKKIFSKIDFILNFKLEYVFILVLLIYLIILKFFNNSIILYFFYFDLILVLTFIFLKKARKKFILNKKNIFFEIKIIFLCILLFLINLYF